MSKADELDAFLAAMKPEDWERAKEVFTPQEQEELAAMIERHRWVQDRRKLYGYYPETGPLRRELYVKHMEFFRSGIEHHERAFIGGNRTGKSFCICYEATCHLTGWYPDWWEGRRFAKPITAWFAGENAKDVRESLQEKLLGKQDALGTGLVPHDLIVGRPTARAGVAEGYDTFSVKHASGGVSRGVFKTYDQGRTAFQAAQVDVMVFDEEPPQPVYSEGTLRTMSTTPGVPNGLVMCAFTPMLGLSYVYLLYLPGGKPMSKVAA